MSANVSMNELPILLKRLEDHRHVGKFYLPEPDQGILQELKDCHDGKPSLQEEDLEKADDCCLCP